MRAVLFAVMMIGIVMAGIAPARADDCSDLSDLMVRRKALTKTVESWHYHPAAPADACAVLTDLAGKTERTILDIGRLRQRCETPSYLIPSLGQELFLLLKAEERMCALARPDQVAAAP